MKGNGKRSSRKEVIELSENSFTEGYPYPLYKILKPGETLTKIVYDANNQCFVEKTESRKRLVDRLLEQLGRDSVGKLERIETEDWRTKMEELWNRKYTQTLRKRIENLTIEKS